MIKLGVLYCFVFRPRLRKKFQNYKPVKWGFKFYFVYTQRIIFTMNKVGLGQGFTRLWDQNKEKSSCEV